MVKCKVMVEASRVASLAAHTAASMLANAGFKQEARILRSAEALCRAATAQLLAQHGAQPDAAQPSQAAAGAAASGGGKSRSSRRRARRRAAAAQGEAASTRLPSGFQTASTRPPNIFQTTPKWRRVGRGHIFR